MPYRAAMTDHLTIESNAGVAVIGLDDGKANALDHALIDGIDAALGEIASDPAVRALVIRGRPGRFSAGFDLNTMKESPEAALALVDRGARMLVRLFGFPVPVIAACSGHAIAAGSLILLASDLRIGADVDAKIGLNEVSIGMPLPVFAVELARARLSRRHYTRATALATLYSPADAVDVGFLDEVVPVDDLHAIALDRAGAIAGSVSRTAFAATRPNDRQATIDLILSSLDGEDTGAQSGS